MFSLLAREINWLETMFYARFDGGVPVLFYSLLAREINWLETSGVKVSSVFRQTSLLAREINWLETISIFSVWVKIFILPTR